MASSREDELRAEFLSDVRDMHIKQVRQGTVILVEEVFVERRASDHFSAVQHEVLDQAVFAGGQLDRCTGAPYRARRGVERDLANFNQGGGLSGGTPDERTQPGKQFR